MPEESLQKLYKSGSEFWDIGDYDTFRKKMQVPESRKKFYSALSEHYDLGGFDVFEGKIISAYEPIRPPEPAPPPELAISERVELPTAIEMPEPTFAETTASAVDTGPVATLEAEPEPELGPIGVLPAEPRLEPEFRPAVLPPTEIQTKLSQLHGISRPQEMGTPLGRFLTETVEQAAKGVVGSTARAIRNVDKDIELESLLDNVVNWAATDEKEYLEKWDREENPFLQREIAQMTPNLGYSVVTMLAGAGGGIAGTYIGTPLVGYAAALATSGGTSYRITRDQKMSQLFDMVNAASLKERGHPLSNEEWKKVVLQNDYLNLARKHALYEAIPEAAGQVLGFGVIRGTVGNLLKRTGVKLLPEVAIVAEAITAKIPGKARLPATILGRGAVIQASEQLQELYTNYNQQRLDAEHGLAEQPTVSGVLKDQAFQVALLTSVMGSGAAVGGKFYDAATERIKEKAPEIDEKDFEQRWEDKELGSYVEQIARQKEIEAKVEAKKPPVAIPEAAERPLVEKLPPAKAKVEKPIEGVPKAEKPVAIKEKLKFTNKDLEVLSKAQRGEPEQAMVEAQKAMGGGLFSYAVEHIGDLTHRMAEFPEYNKGAGYENVLPKVRRVLKDLRQGYGFGREVEENLRSNAKYEGIDYDTFLGNVKEKLEVYREAHEKLPVKNDAQRTAQQAAIALADMRFDDAEVLLAKLMSHMDTVEDWVAYANEGRIEKVAKPAPPAAEKPVAPPPKEKIREKLTPVERERAKAAEVPLKEQKAYLIREIDKAISKAEIEKVEPQDYPIEQQKWDAKRQKALKPNKFLWESNKKKYGTVVIKVPGDGVFTLLNTKESLKEFKKRAKSFPTAPPPKAPTRLKVSPKPLERRITGGFGVEYYNEFRPRKQEIITATIPEERNYYQGGFYSDGKYAIKVDAKPGSKQSYTDIEKGKMAGYAALGEKAKPSELIAEYMLEDYERKTIPRVHVVTQNKKHFVLMANQVDAILTKYPNAKPFTLEKVVKQGDAGMTFFKDKGEVVGFAMPLAYQTAKQGLPTGKLSELPEIVQKGYKELIKAKPVEEVKKLPAEEGVEAAISLEKPIVEKPIPKTINQVEVDRFLKWPEKVKKVGGDYWTEVMATAKKLQTPYRYKALRKTMLGVFRHEKGKPEVPGRIELKNITDALSATHELGHDIDWLINKREFPSSIKKRFPETTVGEKELRTELKKVSGVMRTELWKESEKVKSVKAYLSRHTELMADFVAHYILNPKTTKKLAPNVTRAFESRLADNEELFETISKLQSSRYEGPIEPAVAEHIRETFPLPEKYEPLQLNKDLQSEDYVKTAESMGIQSARNYKALIFKAEQQAQRIDKLIPNKDRQIDLMVLAEKGSKNPWTGRTLEEIKKERLNPSEEKALNLYRAYQEEARQTVNEYLRPAGDTEYIGFLEDYFIHAYETPMTEKYKSAISKWAKKSPQARRRILPDLATAVELGLKPRAKTLSDGLRLWAGINYRVATNKAFLKALPDIMNDDGISILQSPKDFPEWPTVDYWPIRKTYAIPIKGRGVLLFQGRVAVDPRIKPFIDAMFGYRIFNSPMRILEGFNAIAKAFELTLFSLFHHQAEYFSACGALGRRTIPFVGGYWGKKAEVFGKKRLFGVIPAHIRLLEAGRELERTPEFIDDYVKHGGQLGRITTEGISTLERMMVRAEDFLKNVIRTKPIVGKAVWFPYIPTTTARRFYSKHQHILWDNVQRVKMVTYYHIVADGMKNSNLPIKEVKDIAAKYTSDNYGGQEWLNTCFRKPIVRQFFTQLEMSLDWTWSQIKTGHKIFAYGGKTTQEKARRKAIRKLYRKHWFRYLTAVAAVTIAGNFALNRKWPWDNEPGHEYDIDWTGIFRSLPWNRNWKEKGDYNRRYIALGKAGRELIRWYTDGLVAFGYKLSPVASGLFEQATGYTPGSSFPEPWARDDLEAYEEIVARFKGVLEKFRPFAFSGNNAFLAFPSRKGMTKWKATRAYEDIYEAQAHLAMGGIDAKLSKTFRILDKDEEKLRKDIAEGCEINRIDAKATERYALAGIRSKYYRKWYQAAKNQNIKQCDKYSLVLLALGVTPKGIMASLKRREFELPKEVRDFVIKSFEKMVARQTKLPKK